MPELLLELGCEELPAWAVGPSAVNLASALHDALAQARLEPGEPTYLSTPRRLIVRVEVAASQADSESRLRGPALAAAYCPDGEPTQALQGFCRSKGLEVSQLEKDGDYVWATVREVGRAAAEVAREVVPQAIGSLSFKKTMRWAEGKTRFARPVRWIVANLDGHGIGTEFAGVSSGPVSRGHRFLSPEEFEAGTFENLVRELRKRKVEPDRRVRISTIRDQAVDATDGKVVLDEALIEENADLTEWPVCHVGEVRGEYLGLPFIVLGTLLAKHLRFLVLEPDGPSPSPKFVAVRNGGEEDAVRRGNEWVANARLDDAQFFWNEDAKRTMDEFLAATSGITFQAKLGTVRERADRLSALARQVAQDTGADEAEAELARLAGLYAKADLSTGLVGELDELQGHVGGIYLRREGADGAVCHAIATHYDARLNPTVDSPEARTALRLLMADNLDKLAGYLGLGLEPTGSSDPYGLRRSANLLVETAWSWPTGFPGFAAAFTTALGLYREQGIELDGDGAEPRFHALMRARCTTLLEGFRHDVATAAASEGPASADPRRIRVRARVLDALVAQPGLVQAGLRPVNIVAAARKKGIPFAEGKLDPDLLESAEGEALWAECDRQEPLLAQAFQAEDEGGVVRCLQALAAPIDRYFESTMVMDEDPQRCAERLKVALRAAMLWLMAGDLSALAGEP
ncbi:MAG: glycine--tRNA ligase subunit beta [Fimbriimonadaceae bacterium]|nr:glycine--tRNA ligase subunit beta [Fimbriimonadaceae bacterium]